MKIRVSPWLIFYFALQFCRQRGIETGGLGLSLTGERGEHGLISVLRLELWLPPSFPAKYREAMRIPSSVERRRHKAHSP